MAPPLPAHEVSLAELQAQLTQLRGELDELKHQRRSRRRHLVVGLGALSVLAVAGLAHASTLTDGLYVFVPGDPAVAAETNANFSTLRQYLRNKVGADLTTPNVAVAGTLSAGATTLSSLVVTGSVAMPGYELSCGESSFLTTFQGYAFCCQINVRNGETRCNLATNTPATTWSATSFIYPNMTATTLGHYHLSCVAGTPSANFPFCCRMDANTGATQCGQGANYGLGATPTLATVPF